MEYSQVETRLCAIEERLKRIELGLHIPNPTTSQQKATHSSTLPSSALPNLTGKEASSVKENYVSKVSTQQSDFHGGNWLGIIAVLCFVLAAGFIIKLSIDSGWLTPIRQIGLAALFGFALIGAGLKLIHSDRAFASYLPAAGIVILYLSAFAAHGYYHLVSYEIALVLTVMVSSLCIWLYLEINHDVYPLMAVAGAYLAPAIIGFEVRNIFTIFYYLCCSCAFSTISVWVSSRVLTVISAYSAILMTFWAGHELRQDGLVASVLALHFLIFSLGTYLYSRTVGENLTKQESWSFLPVLLIFYAIEYYFTDRALPGFAPWLSLSFAGLLLVLYAFAKKCFAHSLNSHSLIMAFVSVVFLHSVYLELLPEAFKPWLMVIILAALVFAPLNLVSGKHDHNEPLFFPFLAALAVVAIEYLSIMQHLLDGGINSSLGVAFAGVACLWGIIIRPNSPVRSSNQEGSVVLYAAHALSIMGLYRLTTDVGSLAVSASWLFYAVGVIALAFVRKDRTMAHSALFVLGFSAAKALLYDAASAPTIVRILCLMLTGVVLYGCGHVMRKIAVWKESCAA